MSFEQNLAHHTGQNEQGLGEYLSEQHLANNLPAQSVSVSEEDSDNIEEEPESVCNLFATCFERILIEIQRENWIPTVLTSGSYRPLTTTSLVHSIALPAYPETRPGGYTYVVHVNVNRVNKEEVLQDAFQVGCAADLFYNISSDYNNNLVSILSSKEGTSKSNCVPLPRQRPSDTVSLSMFRCKVL